MEHQLYWWFFPALSAVTAGLGLVLIPVAMRTDFTDQPGERKVHDTITSLTGGPAIFLSLFAFFFFNMHGHHFVDALLVAALLIFVTGMADDRLNVNPILRVVVQVLACSVMIFYGDTWLDHLGPLFFDRLMGLGPLTIPITIFAAIGVINAFNMIDGIDGLSGGIFIVAAGGMAMFAGAAGANVIYWVLVASLFAVLGFLVLNARFPWNPKARVFLGDSGSLVLGFILAWCFIGLGSSHNMTHERVFMPMTAVWLFAIPLCDTFALIWRRARAGKSPFYADMGHLHHLFMHAGFTPGWTTGWIVLLALVCALVGIVFEVSGLPDYFSFWTFVAFAWFYKRVTRGAWVKRRFLGRDFVDKKI